MKVLTLLGTRRFLPLFLTQFFGAFNDNTFKNALVILITYKISTLSGLQTQLLITAAAGIFIFPFFLFSAIAGQLADKYEKATLIKTIKLIEIALMGIAATGFYLQSIFLLMMTLFGLGAHAAFFGPVKYAILPEQLKENELIAGNGLIEGGTFLAILLGTILGGALILLGNGEYLISSITIGMAVMGWTMSHFIPKTFSGNRGIRINFNIFKGTYALVKKSSEQKQIFLIILGISWFWLFGAVFLAEFPVFAKDTLHADQSIVTWFLTLFSVGLAIGSLFCNRLLRGKVLATYVPVGAIGMSIFTVDLYFAAKHFQHFYGDDFIHLSQFLFSWSGLRISLDLVITAIFGGIYTVPLYALLQHDSDEEERAQIIASNNIMNALFMVVGAVCTMGLLKLQVAINEIFLIIGIVNAIFAVYICRILPTILIKMFFRWLLTFLYRVKVKGLNNYYKAGERVVIISNHTSFLDALLLSTFLPDKLTFAVNTNTAQKWWIKLFLKLVTAYPMDPTNPMALKALIEFIKTDKRCVIFPEGRLTMTGTLMKIYEGPGLVADKSKAKLLPIKIEGAQYTPFSRLRDKVKLKLLPSITITVFPPQEMNIPAEYRGRKRRHKIGIHLYDVMTDMMFASTFSQKMLFESLLDAKSLQGAKLQIIEDVERTPVTYQQFITRCFILGSVIAKATQPKQFVGVLLPNMTTNAITFFALQAYGRTPAMLNYSTGIRNNLLACQAAQIKIVYTARKFVEVAKLEEHIAALEKENIQIVYLEDLRKQLRGIDKLKGLVMGLFPRLFFRWINSNKVEPEDAAVVLFTSGSEGTPKGVVLSHNNVQANCQQLKTCVDFNLHDKIFNTLPVFHSFGLTGGMLLPILSGIKLFLYPSPLHYRIVPELAYDTNATIFFGTDTFLAGYAKYAHQYDFYSVRYVFAGAEKLKEETRTLWSNKFGVRVFEGYGTTETAPVLATNTPLQNKIGSVGRLLPGLRYKLKPVPGIEEGGVLTVQGPNVMKGYLLPSQPGVLIPLQDNWYETGDIVSVDEDGFISIQGRLKRFAKIAGEMVSLTMVEQSISGLWPDFQHAVMSVPDAKRGEQLILLTTYQQATREELVRFGKECQMGEIMIPKKILYVKEIPLLGSGKVDYPRVKEVLETLMAPRGETLISQPAI